MLATTVRNARGEDVDGDMRRLTIPSFNGPQLAVGTPIVFRTRTARDVRALTDGTALHPEAGREFERADRLFIRVPVYGGQGLAVSARMLNRRGAELREIPAGALADALYQLDLPLGGTARGDYVIAIQASRGRESAHAMVPIRVR